MKNKIKNFLFKKRIKILRNKKGFSLLEVLIAVAIIGIISAIAVPQFADQRENAAKVASDTSASNIAKAFQNCVVLGSFSSCKTLSALKISCPAGASCASGGTIPNFCAHIKKGSAGEDDFNVCVSVNSTSGVVTRTYGGALLNYKICHKQTTGCNAGNASSNDANKVPLAGAKKCTATNKDDVCGEDDAAADATTNCLTKTYCQQVNNQTGTCAGGNGAGTCS